MAQASTAKLRSAVEEFKRQRGWDDATFAKKTAEWDTADHDELANGWIRQSTFSKRDAELRNSVEQEKQKVKSEYDNRFRELARLEADAVAKGEAGTPAQRKFAENLVAQFRRDAVKWAQDNELDTSKLLITDYSEMIDRQFQESGQQTRTQPAQPHQPNSNGNGNGNMANMTPEQIQAMIDNSIATGGAKLNYIQEQLQDYNSEFGTRIKYNNLLDYIAQHGIDMQSTPLEKVLDEMTDAPTKRAAKAKDAEESRYQERHAREMKEEMDKVFKGNIPAQMNASNVPKRPAPPIFRRSLAGTVTEGEPAAEPATNGNNAGVEGHKGPAPERTLAERRSSVFSRINQAMSQS